MAIFCPRKLPKSRTKLEDHLECIPRKGRMFPAFECLRAWQQTCSRTGEFLKNMAAIGQDDWLERLSATAEAVRVSERRRSYRVPLRWTLYVALPGATYPRRTATENLSCDGFYCVLDEPLTAGQHIDCDLVVPAYVPEADDIVSLRWRVQVIRVEKIDCGERYGLACRIQDYRVILAKACDSSRDGPTYRWPRT
jgi:PilZ domain